MPLKIQAPGGERTWIAGVVAIAGIISSARAFQHSDPLFTIVGLLFLTCGIGLWFNQQWARWATIVLALLLAVQASMLLVTKGPNLLRIGIILAALSGSWQIWKEFAPEQIDKDENKRRPLISFVLLLREPRYLETTILAQILSSAWGGDYSSEDKGKTGEFVVGESPLFMIKSPKALFILNNFARPYFDESPAAVATEVNELRLRKAVEEHKAWLSVDLMHTFDPQAAPETTYPQIAKLIAELAAPDCLAIYNPQTHKINVWDSSLEEKLRGPNPLQDFSRPAFVPVMEVENEDPRMEAAVAEARARWPEFVQAFNQGDGQLFSIKAPVTVDDCTEFIWVKVAGLEPEYIHGTLGNEPVDLQGLKMDDPIEIPLKDLNDWAFIRNGEPVGLFTTKAIAQINKESEKIG